jgi:hypothetical protein
VLNAYTDEYLGQCIQRNKNRGDFVPAVCAINNENFVWYKEKSTASGESNKISRYSDSSLESNQKFLSFSTTTIKNNNNNAKLGSKKDATNVIIDDSDEDEGDNNNSSHIDNAAVLTKFYALTSNVARLINENYDHKNISLPFVMSPNEKNIVDHDGSLIILGRSGTGKTTAILHRMYLFGACSKLMEEEFDLNLNNNNVVVDNMKNISDGVRSFCQLLVTASPILCDAIRRNYDNMCKTANQIKESEDNYINNEKNTNDLLTHSRYANFQNENEKNDLYKNPTSFLNLTETSSPLIITYNSFLKMLDNSLHPSLSFFSKLSNEYDDDGYDDDNNNINNNDIEQRIINHPSEIKFERFATHYYPHFTKNDIDFDASILFTEIMSHIKGSLEALHSSIGCLSEDQYINLSSKRDSALNAKQRKVIYDHYRKYEKLKVQTYRGDYDVLDVINHIYKVLIDPKKNYGVNKKILMHSVYVDEVQDLCPSQIALFQFVCKNPKGFVFAGDTAQTVSLFFLFLNKLHYDIYCVWTCLKTYCIYNIFIIVVN